MASIRSGRLAEAAEELARAALAEADNSSLSVGREAIAGLFQKLDTVNESMAKVSQEVRELKDAMKEQDKFQRINYAIDKFQHGCFDYLSFCRESTNYAGTKVFDYQDRSKSSALVNTSLLSFRKGYGSYLPRAITCDPNKYGYIDSLSENESKEREQKFRDQLVQQIFSLTGTGTKPRVNKEANGSYAIYYS